MFISCITYTIIKLKYVNVKFLGELTYMIKDPKIGASGALKREADSRDSCVGGKLVRNSKYQSDILN